MKTKRIILVCFVFLFMGAIFSFAFTHFLINPESANFTLASLESSSSDFTISFNSITDPEENEPYKIIRSPVCDEWNDEGDCTSAPLNLCPYISLEPKNQESTEAGFPLNASFPWDNALGELDSTDTTDIWTLSVTSPCFEGECPAGYDSSVNGVPLSQSLKGQTFKCDLVVNWNGAIYPVLVPVKTAYAATTTNIMTIEAVFTGENATQSIDPVIIVPGIMGSAKKTILGQYVIDPILHTYDDLIDTLVANGYEKDKTLFTFPYEWRDSNAITDNLLKDKIDEVKNICNCDKVDIVAHSMGGLVAREYIQSDQYQNDVDQLIFLGTPHKGSPEAYLEWEAGEFKSGTFNSLTKKFFEAEALESGYTSLFSYIHNRPISSVQELLPTFDYLKDKDTEILRTYPNNYPRNIFLEALNTNTGLSKLLNSGVRITNIVGDAGETSTINVIRVASSSNPLWANGKPDGFDNKNTDRGLEMGNGDGTVTINGNILDNSISNQELSGDHQRLPTLAESKVFNILTGKIASTTFDHNYGVDVKVLLLQLLSPIDVVVIAPDGKKVGKNFETGEEVNEIEGAFYSGFDTDDEYVTIPNPIDGEYKIELQGTGEGKYEVVASNISDEEISESNFSGIISKDVEVGLEVKIEGEQINEIVSEDQDPPIINIESPEQKDYLRSEKINILVNSSDASGIATTTILMNGKYFKSGDEYDPFSWKLGTTTLFATSTDYVNNTATTSLSFRVIANASSTISDINRVYGLGWIKNKNTKNLLIKQITDMTRFQKKIEFIEQKLKNGKKFTKRVEKMERIIDKLRAKTFLFELEVLLRGKIITKEAYSILKEDIMWIIEH